jgi:class 3 adenylate cyclase/tetratricopeptide (TPR) repeat protein
MACPNCGEPNRRSAKFCRNCGQSINQTTTTAALATAGAPAPDTYVPKHLAEKILATRHTLEGERKQVTVLFADIRDSMKLIENRDPEEAQKIFDPVLKIMMDAVHRYEGTVNQVLGDGIMALFGAPLAHEDHALRACYAALAMQDEMRHHRQRLGQSEESGLHIGVGMNSGEVVVRSIDNDLNIDYSALGQTTHLAARMQELAGPGVSLLSSNTLRQVEGFIQVKSLGTVPVKGVSRPVDSYEIIGATSARTRIQAGALRGLTPLVGRSAEIDIFNKLIHRATDGHGQILAMVGEPGMGKSRLVHEFTRHQLPAGWRVLEATSVSYGKATPYLPLIEMLRRYFQIVDGESSENIRDQVVMHILELDNSLKNAIPPILSLLDALPNASNSANEREHDWLAQLQDIGEAIRRFNSMDPQQRRRYTLDALKRICIRESRRQNLLLVFEDLHWIDHETQAFLDSFMDSLPMTRLMLLVNYRPEYKHGWGEKSYYTQLRVDPLQVSSAAELLSNLLGVNPDLAPLKQLLIERTEGNPFFAEESVRSLVEAGVLTGEKGAYRPGLKIDDLVIPSTVQNVVADRIDRLPVEEKHLLQMAAVIGVIIPFGLLRAVAEIPEDELFRYLGHLQSAEFLYETNLFPEVEYSFKHALINEVAYGALLHDRRTDLHARLVKALEATTLTASHDHIEKLARHAFSGELWDKAVDYSRDAGATALSRSSFRNAMLHFERALDGLRRLPQSPDNVRRGIDLRIEIRSVLFVFHEFKRGFDYLEEARVAAKNLGDQDRLGEVLTCMTAHWNLQGNSEQAVITGRQALQYTAGQKNSRTKIVAHNWLGVAYHNLGQFAASIGELKTALSEIPENHKFSFFGTNGIVSVNCKGWLIRSLAQIGKFKETLAHGEEAIQIATERDYPLSIVFAYYAVGVVALLKGEFSEAIVALERSLSVCEAAEIPVQRPLVVSCLSSAYAYVGRFSEALLLLESTADREAWMSAERSRELPFGKAMRMVWEVEALMLADRRCDAEALVRRVLEISEASKDKGSEGWLRCQLGDLMTWREPKHAEASYTQAINLARKLSMCPLQARCHLGLGRLYAESSNSDMARSELYASIELYRTMSMPFWIAKAERTLDSLR